MRQKLDSWVREIGRPKSDTAVLVPEMDDGIVGVLGHGSA